MATNQAEMQGFSLQIIAQCVDFTYHAPGITDDGLGVLSQVVRPRRTRDVGQHQADTCNTVSAVAEFVPYAETGYAPESIKSINSRCKYLRDFAVTCWDTTRKVNEWYDYLRTLQRAALGGAKRARIDASQLLKIEDHMTEVNLGKVIKVRLQARWWLPEQEPGMHPCKTGGFAKVITVATFYLPWDYNTNMPDVVSTWVNHYHAGVINGWERTVEKATVVFDDRGDYVATRVSPGSGVLTRRDDDGKTRRASVKDARQPSDEHRQRMAFIKKMKLE